jgi:voltage-gated potassium channel Kch
MKTPTIKQRFQYAFDNYMSHGTAALIGGLTVIATIVIIVGAAVVSIGGMPFAPEGSETPLSFGEAAWEGMMRTLDAGTMGGDQGWGFRFVMFAVTVGGVLFVSALIGIINNGLQSKLEQLRKGRSLVIAHDHTLILGWNPQVFTIISELILANESRTNGAVIVILADQDKIKMEDEIRGRVPDTKNTRIICRSGNPIVLTDLEIASPHAARSIIILAEGNDPDTHVIKSVLAITNNPNRRAEPYHIVTQIRDSRNMDVIKMLGTKDVVQPILTNDLIARVVAQTSRQSGLSIVYTELMNFGGDEIYFTQKPELSGKTYGEALFAFEASTLMGIHRADGSIALNPPMDARIEWGDEVFVIAEDDGKLQLSAPSQVPLDESMIQASGAVTRPKPEKALILGWNRSGSTIIRELDSYVAKGSQVMIVVPRQLPFLQHDIRYFPILTFDIAT